MTAGHPAADSTSRAGRPGRAALVILAAAALTYVFWSPLWRGGGLIGADIYAYFLPQKAFYGEQLRAGSLPLWNDRVGWGYPQLAESQTGVFYPINLSLYGLLDANTAFNISMLLHYGLAFAFAWMYARQLELTPIAAALAALVYTYGWFPSRICVEWAIVGGIWLPLALWCVERFLSTRFWRYAIGLAVVLAVQMLAGHFTLAFVTQLTLVAYVPLRLWFAPKEFSGEANDDGTLATSETADGPPSGEAAAVERPMSRRRRSCFALLLAFTSAFLLAAVQLVPTWELKRHSQRGADVAQQNPGYGSIPPKYLLQVVAPSWFWYPEESPFWEMSADAKTNPVEAHLYFGLIPLGLALWALWELRRGFDRRLALWLILGGTALVYTTGALVPLTKHLPGFGFFEGPGRFGLVTTLAVGLLAGCGLDRLLRRTRLAGRMLIVFAAFVPTIVDLHLVARQVTYARAIVDDNGEVLPPPLALIPESKLGRRLAEFPAPARILSPGKNLPSLLKVSTLPVYLGLGPSAYFDPQLELPGAFEWTAPPVPEQIEWLRQGGVTHLLGFVRLDPRVWPVRPVWRGPDLFLNLTMARQPGELWYLNELLGSRGRVAWNDPQVGPPPRLVESQPLRVVIETAAPQAGRLILTDLAYPGWKVTIDGRMDKPIVADGRFRAVDLSAGKHTVIWTYHPTSIYWGAAISVLAWGTLLIVGHIRFWHPHWLVRPAESAAKR